MLLRSRTPAAAADRRGAMTQRTDRERFASTERGARELFASAAPADRPGDGLVMGWTGLDRPSHCVRGSGSAAPFLDEPLGTRAARIWHRNSAFPMERAIAARRTKDLAEHVADPELLLVALEDYALERRPRGAPYHAIGFTERVARDRMARAADRRTPTRAVSGHRQRSTGLRSIAGPLELFLNSLQPGEPRPSPPTAVGPPRRARE